MDPTLLPTNFQPLIRRTSQRPGALGGADLPARDCSGPQDAALAEALRLAPTLGAALHCLADHFELCDSSLRACLQALPGGKHAFLMLEPVDTAPPGGMEHAMARLLRSVEAIRGGPLHAAEAWLAQEAAESRSLAGLPLRRGQAMTGLLLATRDLEHPLPGADAAAFEAARRRLRQRSAAMPPRLASRVRIIVSQLLPASGCTHDQTSAALTLHPRTLQRRLREEGTSFETIKDQVRRELALRHLGRANVSLLKMTEILGYSETSVLTRSCQRWFSASPRQLRKRQQLGAEAASRAN